MKKQPIYREKGPIVTMRRKILFSLPLAASPHTFRFDSFLPNLGGQSKTSESNSCKWQSNDSKIISELIASNQASAKLRSRFCSDTAATNKSLGTRSADECRRSGLRSSAKCFLAFQCLNFSRASMRLQVMTLRSECENYEQNFWRIRQKAIDPS